MWTTSQVINTNLKNIFFKLRNKCDQWKWEILQTREVGGNLNLLHDDWKFDISDSFWGEKRFYLRFFFDSFSGKIRFKWCFSFIFFHVKTDFVFDDYWNSVISNSFLGKSRLILMTIGTLLSSPVFEVTKSFTCVFLT